MKLGLCLEFAQEALNGRLLESICHDKPNEPSNPASTGFREPDQPPPPVPPTIHPHRHLPKPIPVKAMPKLQSLLPRRGVPMPPHHISTSFPSELAEEADFVDEDALDEVFLCVSVM